MKTFECKDAGFECDWKVSGSSDEEILQRAGEHGREKHGMTNFTDDLKKKVKSMIRDVKAA